MPPSSRVPVRVDLSNQYLREWSGRQRQRAGLLFQRKEACRICAVLLNSYAPTSEPTGRRKPAPIETVEQVRFHSVEQHTPS